jgi:glycosyltransferase involved in cell wall biosynthesis
MHKINTPPTIYSDPWKTTFEKRVLDLVKGHKRVAYYYDNPDSSTFRYRAYNMIQVLNESQGNYSAAYFMSTEIDKLDRIIDIADIFVICRSRYTNKINRLITRARNKGKFVYFDIDDLVFEPSYIHLLLDTLDEELNQTDIWDFWHAYVGRIRSTLDLCNNIITTNEYLANKVVDYTKKSVCIIPNFLNKEQIYISDKIYSEKKLIKLPREDKIYIGYFSGSPTHNKDFEVASDALICLLEKDPRLILLIAGHMDNIGKLNNYENRIKRLPMQDFINLQRQIGDVDINIVPLQNNEFTNCKSELKYFEAAVVGTVSIATPIFTYKNAIRDGENGYLAKSFEWYDKLSYVINHIYDINMITEEAYSDCKKKYAWYNQIDLIKKTLFQE